MVYLLLEMTFIIKTNWRLHAVNLAWLQILSPVFIRNFSEIKICLWSLNIDNTKIRIRLWLSLPWSVILVLLDTTLCLNNKKNENGACIYKFPGIVYITFIYRLFNGMEYYTNIYMKSNYIIWITQKLL